MSVIKIHKFNEKDKEFGTPFREDIGLFLSCLIGDNYDIFKTDVVKTNDKFEMKVNLPYFIKENISMNYSVVGFFTISANHESEENDEFEKMVL